MNSPFQDMGAAGRMDVTSTLGFRRIRSPLSPFGDAPSGGWAPENDPTRATSTPDYDDWGPDSWWTGQDWLTWHRALKDAYGLEVANARFIAAWQQQGLGSGALGARSFDSSFRDYARANGFFDGLYWGLGSVTRPIGTTTDVTTGISEGVSTVANLSKWAIPAAAIVLGYLWLREATPRKSYR